MTQYASPAQTLRLPSETYLLREVLSVLRGDGDTRDKAEPKFVLTKGIRTSGGIVKGAKIGVFCRLTTLDSSLKSPRSVVVSS